jgi:hypothetical protein
MKSSKVVVKCGAQFEDNICSKPAGHSGKHLDAGTDELPKYATWTDAGAARVAAEKAAEVATVVTCYGGVSIAEVLANGE